MKLLFLLAFLIMATEAQMDEFRARASSNQKTFYQTTRPFLENPQITRTENHIRVKLTPGLELREKVEPGTADAVSNWKLHVLDTGSPFEQVEPKRFEELELQHYEESVVTPDWLWYLVALQFSKYVNEYPEELRHLFVAHEGKKQLTIKDDQDWGYFFNQMQGLIKKSVVTKNGKNVVDALENDFLPPPPCSITYPPL